MKTAVSLPLALFAAAACNAAEMPPQKIRQDVTRLVLLPGPHLTSPAKGAPPLSTMPGSAPDRIEFVPATPAPAAERTRGTLSLGTATDEARREFAPPARPAAAPAADTLRFDATFRSTAPGATPLVAPKRSEPAPADDAKRD